MITKYKLINNYEQVRPPPEPSPPPAPPPTTSRAYKGDLTTRIFPGISSSKLSTPGSDSFGGAIPYDHNSKLAHTTKAHDNSELAYMVRGTPSSQ